MAPDLFERAGFEAFVEGLAAATLVRQWGEQSVGKVGGKIFAIHNGEAGAAAALSFKCSELSFELLPGLEGIAPAPYLARARWVRVARGSALGNGKLADYLVEAHRLVAARLTRRQRADLGLEAVIPAARGKP